MEVVAMRADLPTTRELHERAVKQIKLALTSEELDEIASAPERACTVATFEAPDGTFYEVQIYRDLEGLNHGDWTECFEQWSPPDGVIRGVTP